MKNARLAEIAYNFRTIDIEYIDSNFNKKVESFTEYLVSDENVNQYIIECLYHILSDDFVVCNFREREATHEEIKQYCDIDLTENNNTVKNLFLDIMKEYTY